MSSRSTSGTPPNLDAVMRTLADGTRRAALRFLLSRDEEGPVDLERLAAAVGDGGDDARTVRSLHHVHLPRLDRAGVVAYDPAERRVRPAGDLTRSPPETDLSSPGRPYPGP